MTLIVKAEIESNVEYTKFDQRDAVEKYDQSHENSARKLKLLCTLTASYVFLEVWISHKYNSLALLSDATHNLSDVVSLFLALYMHRLEKRSYDSDVLPHGYKRAEVLGGMINSVSLMTLCAYIIFSALPKFLMPQEMEATYLYIGTAMIGILVNIVGIFAFINEGKKSVAVNSHEDHHTSCSSKTDCAVEMQSQRKSPGKDLEAALPPPCEGLHHRHNKHYHLQERCHDSCSNHSSSSSNETVAYDVTDNAFNNKGFINEAQKFDLTVSTIFDSNKTLDLSAPELNEQSNFKSTNQNDHRQNHSHEQSQRQGLEHNHTHGHSHCHGHEQSHSHGQKKSHHHDHTHDQLPLAESCSNSVLPPKTKKKQPWYAHSHSHHLHGNAHEGCSHSHARDGGSINLWAVLIHSAVDALSSTIICITALAIKMLGDPNALDVTDYLDPLVSILLSMFSIVSILPVCMKSVQILMEGSPEEIDMVRVKESLLSINSVEHLERLIITQINSRDLYKGAVKLFITQGADSNEVLRSARSIMRLNGVGHITVEIESLF
mmetsp:Transcript_12215/g.17235  ORF Transcript_12215/g.17235 Transcript_12215/m.17235 type:complete len:547 (+) Transcript_12215:123-1763(+)